MRFPLVLAFVLLLTCLAGTGCSTHESYSLVEQLAVTDTAPDSERLAHTAAEHLSRMGYDALPALISHVNDQRESIAWSAVLDPTVGDVCFSLLSGLIHPVLAGMHYASGEYLFVRREIAVEWWLERRTWTLHQLKIEALLYGLSMARRNAQHALAVDLERQLGVLGMRDIHDVLPMYDSLAATLVLPGTAGELVMLISRTLNGSYMQKRYQLHMRDEARAELISDGDKYLWKLVEQALSGPHSVTCFDLVQRIVELDRPGKYRRFCFLKIGELAEWWQPRCHKSLSELQREALNYSIESAVSGDFSSDAEREECLEFFQMRLRGIK